MSSEQLAACRTRLERVADETLEQRADTLEFVHRSLVAELDDLLDGDGGARDRAGRDTAGGP
jgi:hypothetical protein